MILHVQPAMAAKPCVLVRRDADENADLLPRLVRVTLLASLVLAQFPRDHAVVVKHQWVFGAEPQRLLARLQGFLRFSVLEQDPGQSIQES